MESASLIGGVRPHVKLADFRLPSFGHNQMPKKTSLPKKPSEAEEKHGKEQAKPFRKPGKLGKEIDEIFGDRKRKRVEPEKSKKSNKNADSNGGSNENPRNKKLKKKKRDVEKKTKGDRSGRSGDLVTRPRKRTEDGLAVYTEEDLGVNKADAGCTPLCPFDCSCCF